jgi:hypothetical protein
MYATVDIRQQRFLNESHSDTDLDLDLDYMLFMRAYPGTSFIGHPGCDSSKWWL